MTFLELVLLRNSDAFQEARDLFLGFFLSGLNMHTQIKCLDHAATISGVSLQLNCSIWFNTKYFHIQTSTVSGISIDDSLTPA